MDTRDTRRWSRRGVTKAASRDPASDFAVDTPLLLNSPPPFKPSPSPLPRPSRRGATGRAVNFTRTRGKVRDPRLSLSLSRVAAPYESRNSNLAIIENATTRRRINDHRLRFERDSFKTVNKFVVRARVDLCSHSPWDRHFQAQTF